MCVDTVVPVSETNYVDNVTGLECADCLVNLCVGACKVGLYAEVVLCAVLFKCNVDIVANLIVLVGDAYNCKTAEGNEHVLVVNELFACELACNVGGLCNVLAADYLNLCVNDFNFACPFSLNTGNANLCAGNKLCSSILCAVPFVYEVAANTVLKVESKLACASLGIIPPALLGALPDGSVALLVTLVAVWTCLGAYFVISYIKKRKNE